MILVSQGINVVWFIDVLEEPSCILWMIF